MNDNKDKQDKLAKLHDKLANELLRRVNDPEVKSSDLNVARQFLKDNNIEAVPVQDSPLAKLADKLPFSEEELKDITKDQIQ